MIKGEVLQQKNIVRAEVNYRKLTALNCSMIKKFDSDPVKFFEEFKLGRKRRETSKSTALIIGDLVDFYLLDCKGDETEFNNRFDEKFALYSSVKGSAQAFILADTLYDVTMASLNEDGEVTRSFDVLFSEAFEKVQAMKKYKGATEAKALEDFNNKAYDYYQVLIENTGKCVVDISLLDKSKKIAEMMVKDPFTADVFMENDEIEYFPKFPVEWVYTTKAGKKVACKSEIDILRIDHHHKTIYLQDLKTTFDNEMFEYGYIKNQYYLQGAFYYLAIDDWARSEGMADYKIMPMEFIVGDTSSNNRRPIRYTTGMGDLDAGLHGFSLNGTYHRGVDELMEEISWAEDNNVWNASKAVIDNGGVLKLKLKYE